MYLNITTTVAHAELNILGWSHVDLVMSMIKNMVLIGLRMPLIMVTIINIASLKPVSIVILLFLLQIIASVTVPEMIIVIEFILLYVLELI